MIHRASYQLGWKHGREDYDRGQTGDALSAWQSLLPPYKRIAIDLLSYTRGYTRGAFMTDRSAAYEVRRSETYLQRRGETRSPSRRDNGTPEIRGHVERIGNVERHDLKIGRSTILFHIDHDKRLIHISSIRVPQTARRKGEATRALRHVLALADQLGYDTRLDASPLDKRTSLGRLVRWYQSHGFEMTGQSVNVLGHPKMLRAARRDRARRRA